MNASNFQTKFSKRINLEKTLLLAQPSLVLLARSKSFHGFVKTCIPEGQRDKTEQQVKAFNFLPKNYSLDVFFIR